MDSSSPFKIALGILFSCFTVIRVHYRRRSARDEAVPGPDGMDQLLLRGLVFFEAITLLGYLFFSEQAAWTAVALPAGLRWLGAVLGTLALVLFVWVHHSLGDNFASSLRIRDDQTLVTTGPYRRVRHPMYVAFYLLHVAAFLLAANWFIGVTWLGGLTLVIATRVAREEELLIARFGQEYLCYMQRTSRFLPFVRLKTGGPRNRPRDTPV
jgi:protein-S-isoprenylcysteine O-methyltransferase Ste14